MPNKINQIVRLKHVMQRWRRRCTDSKQIHPGTLAVYVGTDRHRFIIPTRYLHFPVFISLLNKAVEEFGFQKTGGLLIPCDVTFFMQMLKVLERNEREVNGLDLEDFVTMFSDSGLRGCCIDDGLGLDCVSFTPLLQKAKV